MNVGLSSTNRTETLTLREDFASGAETGNAAVATSATFDAGFRTVPIELRRLDDLWPELDIKLPIDFVKVDIEGHEDHFLKGAKETIGRHCAEVDNVLLVPRQRLWLPRYRELAASVDGLEPASADG